MHDGSPRTLGGRYRLGARIGEGGFGVVYEADDLGLKRRVAVKLLDPARDTSSVSEAADLRDRFEREAIATAAIIHPNVVTVFDVGVDDEVYLVMELLRGRSLAEELERWPTGMPPERALPLFVGALRGLAAGHAAGIVHKDLKPKNLFLDQVGSIDETLRIIDFGVARVMHEQRLTATGKLAGTPRYLAPEYIQHLEVSPALDVYQMGLILVEMLSAMPCVPRRLDLVTCCQRHVDGTLKIPSGLQAGELGDVIRRALSVDPADRFRDAGEFAAALAAVRPAEVSTAAPGETKPTPRLGVKPLRPSVTQPMHGGPTAVRSKPDTTKPKRQARTGPTKRLGPSQDILEELAKREAQPREHAQPEVRTKPTAPQTVITELGEPDPLRGRRRMIYALVAMAIIVVLVTAAVLLAVVL